MEINGIHLNTYGFDPRIPRYLIKMDCTFLLWLIRARQTYEKSRMMHTGIDPYTYIMIPELVFNLHGYQYKIFCESVLRQGYQYSFQLFCVTP